MKLQAKTDDPGVSAERDDPDLAGLERGFESRVHRGDGVSAASEDLEKV